MTEDGACGVHFLVLTVLVVNSCWLFLVCPSRAFVPIAILEQDALKGLCQNVPRSQEVQGIELLDCEIPQDIHDLD